MILKFAIFIIVGVLSLLLSLYAYHVLKNRLMETEDEYEKKKIENSIAILMIRTIAGIAIFIIGLVFFSFF